MRAYYEGKTTNMENAARLTGNTSATHGFGTAATASELNEIRAAVTGAIKEAVAEAVAEERAANTDVGTNEEQANAITQLWSENKMLDEEVAEMSKNITRLSGIVGNLQSTLDRLKNNSSNGRGDNVNNNGGDGSGSRGGPRKRGRSSGPNKNHPRHGKYTVGMTVDPSWSNGKKC